MALIYLYWNRLSLFIPFFHQQQGHYSFCMFLMRSNSNFIIGCVLFVFLLHYIFFFNLRYIFFCHVFFELKQSLLDVLIILILFLLNPLQYFFHNNFGSDSTLI